jgi:putative MATE family efflux protein
MERLMSLKALALYRSASNAMRQILGLHSDSRVDGTQGSLEQAMRRLSLPMAIEMFAESIFVVVDLFWVARLNVSAIAVIGVVEAAMSLVYAFAIGLAYATAALVARRVGETGRVDAAGPLVGQALIITALVSFALGLPMCIYAVDILRLIGADEPTAEMGAEYAQVMFAGNITLTLMFVCSASLRATGEANVPMRALWLANACNMVLTPCLIFGWAGLPALGIVGAAVGTVVSRALGVAYQTRYLVQRDTGPGLQWEHLRPDGASMLQICRISWSGVWQMLIASTSALGLYAIASQSGSVALAGSTVALRVSQFVLLPSLGVARAAATLVGQNLGAGMPDRAATAVMIAVRLNAMVFGAIGLLLFIAAQPVARLLISDPYVLEEATLALRVVAVALPFYAVGMCLEAAFNGAGDTSTPALINFVCFWLLQVPLAWVLAIPAGLGSFGLYLAVPLGFAMLVLLSAILFVRGKWKTHQI